MERSFKNIATLFRRKMNRGDGGAGSFSDLDDYIRDNYIEDEAGSIAPGDHKAQGFVGTALSGAGETVRKAVKATFARSAKECVPYEEPEETVEDEECGSSFEISPADVKEPEEYADKTVFASVCVPMPEPERKLDDVVSNLEKSFMEMVFFFADQKGLSDSGLQKRANIDRKAFSKLRCGTTKNPSKSTALALAIALKLNLDEAKDLLARAGYAFSPCSKQDVIVRYFIEREAYDIDAVNYALYEHGEQILGTKQY